MEYSEHTHDGWEHHHWGHGHMLPILPLIGAFVVLHLIFASGLWLPLLLIGAFLFFFRPMMHAHWRRGGWRGHMPGRPPFEGMPGNMPFGRPPMMGRHPMGGHGRGGWGRGCFGWDEHDQPAGESPEGQPEKPKREGSDPRFV